MLICRLDVSTVSISGFPKQIFVCPRGGWNTQFSLILARHSILLQLATVPNPAEFLL